MKDVVDFSIGTGYCQRRDDVLYGDAGKGEHDAGHGRGPGLKRKFM